MNKLTEQYIKLLRDRQLQIQNALVTNAGGITDYASYRALAGEFNGIEYALSTLTTLLQGDDGGEI